jgi:hypothetical protein
VTRYLSSRLGAPRIQRERIPTGFAGTRRTAAHVARLIREGSSDFYVRQKAIDIVLARGVAPKDYIGEIDALFRWVQRHVRYTKDPFQVEVLHAPRRMLELKAGDCDDMTILLGALVKSIGHPVRLVLTGPNARRPDLFSHIYLEAQHQGDWIPLDATMPFGMGWSPRAPVRLVLSIEEDSTHDQPAARTAATARSTDSRADHTARAGARLAPRSAARDTNGRSPATRSESESVVGSATPPTTARPQHLAANDAAPHLAAGTREAASAANHPSHPGAAQGMGSAGGAATAAPAGRRGDRIGNGQAMASSSARETPPRGDRATAASAASDPTDRMERPSLSDAIENGSALYRRFSRLPARSLRRVAYQRLMPPVVVELGQLMAVVYRSDKWVGHPRTYIHYMDDPPRLVSDVNGRRLFVVGGSYRITARGIEG